MPAGPRKRTWKYDESEVTCPTRFQFAPVSMVVLVILFPSDRSILILCDPARCQKPHLVPESDTKCDASGLLSHSLEYFDSWAILTTFTGDGFSTGMFLEDYCTKRLFNFLRMRWLLVRERQYGGTAAVGQSALGCDVKKMERPRMKIKVPETASQ
jgi:hypothetical protein